MIGYHDAILAHDALGFDPITMAVIGTAAAGAGVFGALSSRRAKKKAKRRAKREAAEQNEQAREQARRAVGMGAARVMGAIRAARAAASRHDTTGADEVLAELNRVESEVYEAERSGDLEGIRAAWSEVSALSARIRELSRPQPAALSGEATMIGYHEALLGLCPCASPLGDDGLGRGGRGRGRGRSRGRRGGGGRTTIRSWGPPASVPGDTVLILSPMLSPFAPALPSIEDDEGDVPLMGLGNTAELQSERAFQAARARYRSAHAAQNRALMDSAIREARYLFQAMGPDLRKNNAADLAFLEQLHAGVPGAAESGAASRARAEAAAAALARARAAGGTSVWDHLPGEVSARGRALADGVRDVFRHPMAKLAGGLALAGLGYAAYLRVSGGGRGRRK